MSSISITVWSDYVCPWCYIGLGELASVAKDFELKIDWRPYMLRPDAPEEGWELPERYRASHDDPSSPINQRAKSLGLPLKARTRIPNSRRAHECTEFARSQGKEQAFHDGLITRYWSNAEDLHDWAVLEASAKDAGLDAARMKAEVEAGAWRQAVEEGVAAAHALGINAVPTFIVGDKFAIQGAQDARVFRQAFERLKQGL